jgi:hypothetical protein
MSRSSLGGSIDNPVNQRGLSIVNQRGPETKAPPLSAGKHAQHLQSVGVREVGHGPSTAPVCQVIHRVGLPPCPVATPFNWELRSLRGDFMQLLWGGG